LAKTVSAVPSYETWMHVYSLPFCSFVLFGSWDRER
jgi:hypothetical protein